MSPRTWVVYRHIWIGSEMPALRKRVTKRPPPRMADMSSLGDRLYYAFKKDIIMSVFPSGEPLSEKVLAARYGGSRTPLREAAVRLEQENLLRIIPNKGYFIVNMSAQEVNEMYEYRAAVEGVCAEIAARKTTEPSQIQALEVLAKVQYSDRASYFKFVESDTAFHLGIARLTGNNMLVKAVADVRMHMERLMYAASSLAPYSEVTSKEHLAIVEAIKSHDSARARQLVHRHILDAKDKILELAGGRSFLL